jgi:phage shock protein E
MNFIKKHILIITGFILGAIAGYFYHYYIGCISGSCTITSNPLNSTLYGAVMGGAFMNIFIKNKSVNSK